MKSMMIPLVMGALLVPLTSQAGDDLDGNNYYRLSLRGDCKTQTQGGEIRPRGANINALMVDGGPAAYATTRLSTTNLIVALLAEAGVVADPRRCSIVAGVGPYGDVGQVSWWLYCRDGRESWRYRLGSGVLRVSRGDKSASVVRRRISRGNASSRRETSFVRFDFNTELLDHFATLYVIEDKRTRDAVVRQVAVQDVAVEVMPMPMATLQSYRFTGDGHHRTRIPDVEGSCPGKVRIMLSGRIRPEDFQNADYRGTIGEKHGGDS